MDPRANPESGTPAPLIGLTGTIGSGKSTVAELLRERGALILDADLLAREVVRPGCPALEEIRTTFGPAVIAGNGTLDRRALGELVFADRAAREKLEAIVHPRIRAEFLARLPALLAQSRQLRVPIVYVAPLLFEIKNSNPEIVRTVSVWAPAEQSIQRVMARDGLSRERAAARLAAQLPADEKARRADYVIRNEGTPEELRHAVGELYLRVLGDLHLT